MSRLSDCERRSECALTSFVSTRTTYVGKAFPPGARPTAETHNLRLKLAQFVSVALPLRIIQ